VFLTEVRYHFTVKLRLKLRSLLFLITPSFHVGPYDTDTLCTQRFSCQW